MPSSTGNHAHSAPMQMRQLRRLCLLALLAMVWSLFGLTSVPQAQAGIGHPIQSVSCSPTISPAPFGPSGTIYDQWPTFAWSSVPGATSYTLYVIRVSDEAIILRKIGITATNFTPTSPLPANVDLRWKVKGENSCGAGPYSPNMFFRIDDTYTCLLKVAPIPAWPSGTINNTRPTFLWSYVDEATSYTLYVIRVSDEAIILRRTGLTVNYFTPTSLLPANIDLRWKVKGENSCGAGPYSPDTFFRIQ